jgi:hypothetical protein
MLQFYCNSVPFETQSETSCSCNVEQWMGQVLETMRVFRGQMREQMLARSLQMKSHPFPTHQETP